VLAGSDKTCTESVLYDLAWAQRKNNDRPGAIGTYRRLLEKFQAGKLAPAARTELAELLYLDKEYAEAASFLEKVVADQGVEAGTRAIARYKLGWCYAELSQHQKAAEAFGAFALNHPDSDVVPSAMYKAGESHMEAGNLAESEKFFADLLNRFADCSEAEAAQLKLGEVQGRAGNYKDSTATYEKFLKDRGEGSKFAYLAKFGIGWALQNQGRHKEAREWYRKVIETHDGETAARAQFQIGECFLAEKNLVGAAAAFVDVDYTYAYPKWSSVALYQAGRAFEALGQIDNARSRYDLCISKYKDSDSAALAKERLKYLENK